MSLQGFTVYSQSPVRGYRGEGAYRKVKVKVKINKMKKLTLILGVVSVLTAQLVADEKEDVMALGQQKFQLCVACHGADGKGMKPVPGMVMAPSLVNSKIVKGNPQAMAVAVLKGIKKEDTKYVGIMMPLEASLNDEELAAVMTYVRNTYGGKSEVIKEKDTIKWRELYSKSKEPLARAEIEKIAAE
ncbi:MAG: cytochrome c [Verrucomicrobiales bacterium]|nr:cytochrome c [Verrucomicrobiales bacterium]